VEDSGAFGAFMLPDLADAGAKWNRVTENLGYLHIGVLFAELSSAQRSGSSRNHIR
jgi:hypothetical protein